MRRVSAVLGAAAMVVLAAGVFAQGKPDFSGSWTLDAEKTAAANPDMGGGGGRGGGRGGGGMTLKQDATSLTSTSSREGATPVVYKLDGSEVDVPAGRGGMAKAKAMWDGNTIVISTTRDMRGQMVTTKQTYSMEGEWLVVATTGAGRNGGEPTTTKRYYKKGM